MSTTKFGLYKYSTENIGDEIQSIAARRFLPQIDYFIDRDKLRFFNPKGTNNIKLIMNGWYMHKPENWQPISEKIIPLPISMHISKKDPEVVKAFTAPKSLIYLKKNGPVGARDRNTLAFLQQHNIPSYFSGCLTLTLKKNNTPRLDYILAVDISDDIKEEIRQRTKRPIIDMSTYYDPDLSTEARFMLAEYFLYLYESAHCLITTRLHATLPSLAFGTPVLLMKEKDKYEKDRFSGLTELARNTTRKEFLQNPKLFDLDNPPRNYDKYLEYRESLEKSCSKFTGFSNPKNTYRTRDFSELYKDTEFIKIFAKGLQSTHKKLMLDGDVSWLKENLKIYKKNEKALTKSNKKQAEDIENLKLHIRELESFKRRVESSTLWKAAKPLYQASHKLNRKGQQK